ncbi:MAG: hypothetical protein A2X56_11775 [Nitrospirae bacterium GWC2_57_13]|jgi:hypothetical protein|nr:MAG: hypothetical protein A2X56_11775 [Nitrospirae bacterium GWC2_57_13]OGW41745.1 MAG: hypothetical protein A2X57_08815 [Nitrospirae bacterium GWD2_57_8]HAS54375.1 hypothetical protein [Nitrospiraceae bacterium]
MKKIKVLAIALLMFVGNMNISIATTEVETKEETLNYIRVLFSDKKVIETYQKLISEGYSWQDEYANFGSMVDEKHESFYGQVQIVMEKDKGAKRNKVGERRVLVVDFLWSRIGNKIENIKVGTYSQ